MKRLKAVCVIVFAASAMSFVVLLLAFLAVLAVSGLAAADKVWTGIYPVIAWLMALLVCIRFMTR